MDSETINTAIALARLAAKNCPESLEEQADIFLKYKDSEDDVVSVLRGSNALESRNEIFILGHGTILSIENLYKKGFKYLFPVQKIKSPDACECGATINEVTIVDGEPPTIEYSCGRIALRDYSDAVLRNCSPRRCH